VSVKKRLERLKADFRREHPEDEHDEHERERAARSRRAMQRLFHATAKARREEAGLESVEPDLPYTAEDRADDEWFLREVIPEYRARVGYQNEQGRELLDAWEEHTRNKLKRRDP
jgi:hypothetical protein